MSSLFRKTPLLLAARYDALVAEGRIVRCEAQWAAVGALDRLIGELEAQRRPRLPFTRNNPPHGLYLWGEIGRGKTTLMDLFFEAAPVRRKRRTHFHAFMREVHSRLHAARRAGNGGVDPLTSVADALARETRLLCFDEFAVSDIADATILARLFSALLAAEVVVVATSNDAPRELYKGGRNRDLFLPFIDLVERRLEIVQLDASEDFRLSKRRAEEMFFLVGDAEAARAARARFELRALREAHARDRRTPPRDRARQRRNGALRFSGDLRTSARRGGLSRHRRGLRHGHHQRRSANGL